MCGHGEYWRHSGHGENWRHHGHGAGCCQPGGFHGHHRHFPSREERIGQLEEYLKDLKAETKGLEEHLEKLRKGEA